MSNESFANFKGFKVVLNGSDFNQVKENASDRVVEKRDMSGGKSFLGAVNKFVAENLERQATETRKALNPEKYEKEEMAKKLDQVKGMLEEKQKDLVEAKKELSSSKTISKTEKKRLDMEINYLQKEIVELRRNIYTMLSDFSYSHYSMKSGKDDDGTPNHAENSEQRIRKLECIYKRIKPYLEKNPDVFKQDGQQDNRRGEQLR